jgi:hypothetical protein
VGVVLEGEADISPDLGAENVASEVVAAGGAAVDQEGLVS